MLVAWDATWRGPTASGFGCGFLVCVGLKEESQGAMWMVT